MDVGPRLARNRRKERSAKSLTSSSKKKAAHTSKGLSGIVKGFDVAPDPSGRGKFVQDYFRESARTSSAFSHIHT